MGDARSFRVKRSRVACCALLTTGLIGWAAGGTRAGAAAPTGSGRLTTAQIRNVYNPRPHMHVMPTRSLAQRIRASVNPNTVGNMTYHNGPVMQAANNSIPIYWMPSTLQSGASATPSANYQTILNRYFNDIGGSGLYGVNAQYYQTVNGPTEFITNASGLVQAVVDTSAYPTAGAGCSSNGQDCVDDGQVQAEVTKILDAHPSFTTGLSNEYYVFLAPHESQCSDTSECFASDTSATTSNFAYCAYHSWFTRAGHKVIYANMPYGATAAGNGCTGLSSFPNDNDADIEISTTSHEQMESTTDPDAGGGWYFQSLSGEIGDQCAYDYGSVNLDGNLANVQMNGHYYVLQQEWSNSITGCSLGSSGPVNDNFADRSVILPAGGTATGTNVGATKQSGEPNNAGNIGGKSVWWVWLPNGSGNVTVDTCSSSFDTTLGVYTGTSVNHLTSVASNDDSNNCGASSRQSSVTFFASYGSTYWISVDGFNSGSGALSGSITVHATGLGGAAPGAPTIGAVTVGDGWANVAFSAPTSSGGSPIGSYVVTSSTGRFAYVPATARRAVLTNLNDGTGVTLSVAAVNLGGAGSAATSSTVTPASGSVDETTSYNASDNTRLGKNAVYFGQTNIDAQRTSVGVIAYIAGIVHSSVITPVVPTPASSGPNSYTTPWATADQGALVTVMRQYALTPPEAQYFAVSLVGFLLALGGH